MEQQEGAFNKVGNRCFSHVARNSGRLLLDRLQNMVQNTLIYLLNTSSVP